MSVIELRTKAAMLLAQCEELAKVDEWTDEQQSEFEQKMAEVRDLDSKIGKLDDMTTLRKQYTEGQPAARRQPQPEAPVAFKNFGEMVYAVRYEAASLKQLNMTVGEAGGFLVPEQFRLEILQVTPQDAVVRPRATVIPAGSPPDSDITMPALNQTPAVGMYGGISVQWIAEGAAKPDTEYQLLEVRLHPNEVAGSTFITDKLLRNAPAAGALLTTLLRRAIIAAEDTAFLGGVGGGQPLGVLGHPATINVARAVAAQINYPDLVEMYAQFLFGGPAVWVASQSTLPQLMTMADPAGHLVWQPSAREGAPGTLLGIPVILNQRSPALGNVGDLLLADWSYYLIKDGSPLSISASEHVRFRQNQTCVKAFWNVDGQPWLTAPLLLEDGVSTVSPFVALA